MHSEVKCGMIELIREVADRLNQTTVRKASDGETVELLRLPCPFAGYFVSTNNMFWAAPAQLQIDQDIPVVVRATDEVLHSLLCRNGVLLRKTLQHLRK